MLLRRLGLSACLGMAILGNTATYASELFTGCNIRPTALKPER